MNNKIKIKKKKNGLPGAKRVVTASAMQMCLVSV
jgi:hypothetical protein